MIIGQTINPLWRDPGGRCMYLRHLMMNYSWMILMLFCLEHDNWATIKHWVGQRTPLHTCFFPLVWMIIWMKFQLITYHRQFSKFSRRSHFYIRLHLDFFTETLSRQVICILQCRQNKKQKLAVSASLMKVMKLGVFIGHWTMKESFHNTCI